MRRPSAEASLGPAESGWYPEPDGGDAERIVYLLVTRPGGLVITEFGAATNGSRKESSGMAGSLYSVRLYGAVGEVRHSAGCMVMEEIRCGPLSELQADRLPCDRRAPQVSW